MYKTCKRKKWSLDKRGTTFCNKVGSWYNIFQQGRVWIKISPSTWPATQYITGAELGFSDRGCKILATNYLPCYYPYPEPILEQCKAVRYRYSIFIVKNLALFIIKLFFSKICPSSFISWNKIICYFSKKQRTNPELSVFKSKPRVQMIVFLKNRGCNAPAAPVLTPPLICRVLRNILTD